MPHEQIVGTAPLTTAMRARATANAEPGPPKAGRSPRRRSGGNETGFLALVAALFAVALLLARSGRFTAGSDFGYWVGVAGGVAMLLLFLYPLRKRWRPLRAVGTTRGSGSPFT